MKRWVGLLFAAAGVGTSLAGCGSSSPSTSTVIVQQQAPLSKAKFISEGDAICRSAGDEAKSISERYNDLYADLDLSNENSQLPKLGAVVRESAEALGGEVEQLRGLEPPNADRKTIIKMLALVDAQISLTEEIASAFEGGNSESAGVLLKQAKPIKAEAQGIAQGYGFKVCGNE